MGTLASVPIKAAALATSTFSSLSPLPQHTSPFSPASDLSARLEVVSLIGDYLVDQHAHASIMNMVMACRGWQMALRPQVRKAQQAFSEVCLSDMRYERAERRKRLLEGKTFYQLTLPQRLLVKHLHAGQGRYEPPTFLEFCPNVETLECGEPSISLESLPCLRLDSLRTLVLTTITPSESLSTSFLPRLPSLANLHILLGTAPTSRTSILTYRRSIHALQTKFPLMRTLSIGLAPQSIRALRNDYQYAAMQRRGRRVMRWSLEVDARCADGRTISVQLEFLSAIEATEVEAPAQQAGPVPVVQGPVAGGYGLHQDDYWGGDGLVNLDAESMTSSQAEEWGQPPAREQPAPSAHIVLSSAFTWLLPNADDVISLDITLKFKGRDFNRYTEDVRNLLPESSEVVADLMHEWKTGRWTTGELPDVPDGYVSTFGHQNPAPARPRTRFSKLREVSVKGKAWSSKMAWDNEAQKECEVKNEDLFWGWEGEWDGLNAKVETVDIKERWEPVEILRSDPEMRVRRSAGGRRDDRYGHGARFSFGGGGGLFGGGVQFVGDEDAPEGDDAVPDHFPPTGLNPVSIPGLSDAWQMYFVEQEAAAAGPSEPQAAEA